MMQLELFPNRVLAKLCGCLVVLEVNPNSPSDIQGKCPTCGYTQFRDGTGWGTGWTECDNPDGCDFAVLTYDLERVDKAYHESTVHSGTTSRSHREPYKGQS